MTSLVGIDITRQMQIIESYKQPLRNICNICWKVEMHNYFQNYNFNFIDFYF